MFIISFLQFDVKVNLFSTNKFTSTPEEIKTDSLKKIEWKLKKREGNGKFLHL